MIYAVVFALACLETVIDTKDIMPLESLTIRVEYISRQSCFFIPNKIYLVYPHSQALKLMNAQIRYMLS